MKMGPCGIKLGALVMAACFGSLAPFAAVVAQTPPGAAAQAARAVR